MLLNPPTRRSPAARGAEAEADKTAAGGEGQVKKTGQKAKTSSESGGPQGPSIGVPECDEYVTKYEKCLDEKVPDASRATMREAFSKTRQSWSKMAQSEATRASLAEACKQALEAAESSLKSMGCRF